MINAASSIISNVLATFTTQLPQFLNVAMQLVQTLGSGIMQNMPVIIQSAVQTFMAFLNMLVEMAPQLATAALQMVMMLGQNLLNNLPQIVDAAVDIFLGFIQAFIDYLPELIPLALQIVTTLGAELVSHVPDLIEAVMELGGAVVQGIIDGISAAWDGLVSWFTGLWDSLFGNRSVDVNVNANGSGVNGSHANGLAYVPFDGYIAELHKGETVLTAKEADAYRSGRGGVTVVQNIYSQAKTAADLMREARHAQERAVLFGV